jgi:hypothetical protein
LARDSGRNKAGGPEMRRDASSVWDQVKSSMAEWYGVAAEKTEEMARIGVRKYDQLTISRTMDRAFSELGAHVYGALRLGQTDFGQDAKVTQAVARIRDLEEQLARKESEIAEIRGAYHPESAPPAQANRQQPLPGSPNGALDEPEGIALIPLDAVPEGGTGGPESDEVHPSLLPDDVSSELKGRPPVLDAWEEELSRWDEPGPDDES